MPSESAEPVDLSALVAEFDASLARVADGRALTELRNAWLAKKGGRVTNELARLREIPADRKRATGPPSHCSLLGTWGRPSAIAPSS